MSELRDRPQKTDSELIEEFEGCLLHIVTANEKKLEDRKIFRQGWGTWECARHLEKLSDEISEQLVFKSFYDHEDELVRDEYRRILLSDFISNKSYVDNCLNKKGNSKLNQTADRAYATSEECKFQVDVLKEVCRYLEQDIEQLFQLLTDVAWTMREIDEIPWYKKWEKSMFAQGLRHRMSKYIGQRKERWESVHPRWKDCKECGASSCKPCFHYCDCSLCKGSKENT